MPKLPHEIYNESKAARGRWAGSPMTEEDWLHFFGPSGLWKNTEFPESQGDSPTVSIYITHHISDPECDPDPKYGFHYVIAHVRGFHGRGFMPKAQHENGSWKGNGYIAYGTDGEAYKKACAEGQEMVDKLIKESDEWEAEFEERRKERDERASQESPGDSPEGS